MALPKVKEVKEEGEGMTIDLVLTILQLSQLLLLIHGFFYFYI